VNFLIAYLIWLVLFGIFAGTTGLFYAYVRRMATKPWNLNINENFRPAISIIVPAHNEEEVIGKKLENLKALSYPREKVEFIIADDASTDTTRQIVQRFIEANSDLNIKVVSGDSRSGKAGILNQALKTAVYDTIIVSDADSFWPSETLTKSLPFLADQRIGAITGLGIIHNPSDSWTTKTERNYLELTSIIRIGESKVHSTIRFEGGFCMYRRKAFGKFDNESGSDDSGTALEVVQNGYITISVPEALFYTSFPASLAERIRVKSRRAHHLVCLWTKCLKLLLTKKLGLPNRIAIPEIVLFLVNPVVFVVLFSLSVALIILNPVSVFLITLLLLVAAFLLFARRVFVEIIFGNLVLFYSILTYLFGKRYISWDKTKASN